MEHGNKIISSGNLNKTGDDLEGWKCLSASPKKGSERYVGACMCWVTRFLFIEKKKNKKNPS